MTDLMELQQGDLRLLQTERARALLSGRDPARVAYVAADGTPRVYPTYFVWTGEQMVMGTYAGGLKIAALRARPAVAITVDTVGDPPTILQLRGRAELADVAGVVPEYIQAQEQFRGAQAARTVLAEIDRPGLRMVRIAVTPTWAGLIDFQERLPQAMSPRDSRSCCPPRPSRLPPLLSEARRA